MPRRQRTAYAVPPHRFAIHLADRSHGVAPPVPGGIRLRPGRPSWTIGQLYRRYHAHADCHTPSPVAGFVR